MVTSFTGNQAEEGQFARVTANVSDDVQVRNVEFYLDGQLVLADGNFPFEHRFVVPRLTATKNSFRLRSRATDTGGNSTWSEELNVTITRDATPPRLLRISPFDEARLGRLNTISAFFSEAIDSRTLSHGTFGLSEAGPDGLLKTSDDVRVTSGVIAFKSDSLTAHMSFDPDLPFGRYQITMTTGITDLAGNPLAASFESRFEVREITIVAEKGTPTDLFQASANVGQSITIESAGLGLDSVVSFPTRDSAGRSGQHNVPVRDIAPGSRFGQVTVPDEAETGAIKLSDNTTLFLQIVPTITSISGGRGRPTRIIGSGFIEGSTTVRFGEVHVHDQGPGDRDGIDVYDSGGENRGLDVTVPAEGTLPYEVITAGGRSGHPDDVRRVASVAQTGTPANAGEASANVDQEVTLEGEGVVAEVTKVLLEGVNSVGITSITTVTPVSVAADGKSLVFKVPSEARTGIISILNGGSGKLLQIVPRVSQINGGRGRATFFIGSGFIEGLTTVRFGEVHVQDQGPGDRDGIDVYDSGGENRGLAVTVPADGTLPYEVITEGGTSGRAGDVTRVSSVARTGTAANPGAASANVDQEVTLEGEGFVAETTKVVLEGINSVGTTSISTLTPSSVAPDGRSLVFKVPSEARTGIASILNGGSGQLLQIVPTVTSVSAFAPGGISTFFGSGFIEGLTTVRFGAVEVKDQGPNANDGIDVFDAGGENRGLIVTVPADGTAPILVITAGGTSNGLTP